MSEPAVSEEPGAKKSGDLDKRYLDLFGTGRPGSRLAEETKAFVRREILPAYVRSSLQAKYNESLYRRAGTLVYCLVPLAVAAVAVAVLYPAVSALAYFVEFLLLATILLVVLWADRRRSHRNWLEARFRVERLRTAIFFTACGLKNRTGPIAGLEKIWTHTSDREPFAQAHRKDLKEFVISAWIGEQIRYHITRAGRCARMSHRLERAGMVVFFVALVAAAIHSAPLFTGAPAHGTWMDIGLTLVAIVLPAVGAAMGGLRSHREYSRHTRTSRGMSAALTGLAERFAAAESSAELTALLYEADNLMMNENQGWHELMRDAKLEASA
jgi:hypothetical protein